MTLRGIVIVIVAFLTPVGSIGEPKIFLIILTLLLLGLLLWLDWKDGRILVNFPWGAAWLGLAILTWVSASYFWSLDPDVSLRKALSLSLVGGGIVLLFGVDRSLPLRNWNAFGIALSVGVSLYFIFQWGELVTEGALMHAVGGERGDAISPEVVRGITVVTILTWTVLIFLSRARRGGLGIFFGLAALLTVWMTTGTSAAISATLGAIVFLALIKLSPNAVRFMAWAAAAWVLAAPFIMGGLTKAVDAGQFAQTGANASAIHRILIWEFVSDKILERPVLGHGLRSARAIPGGRKIIVFGQGQNEFKRDLFSVHPHNGPLEWWLELGFPGAILGALVVFLLFRWPERIQNPVTRALIMGQLTTAFGIFNLSFGAWQTWWLVALALAAFLTLISLQGAKEIVPGHSELR